MSRTMDQSKLQTLAKDLKTQGGNSRNGYSSKKLKGNHGEIDHQTLHDRNASFEPQLIKKGQTRITRMDDLILGF